MSGPCGSKGGPQGRKGSVNPLALRRPTITNPLLLLLQTLGKHGASGWSLGSQTKDHSCWTYNKVISSYNFVFTFLPQTKEANLSLRMRKAEQYFEQMSTDCTVNSCPELLRKGRRPMSCLPIVNKKLQERTVKGWAF